MNRTDTYGEIPSYRFDKQKHDDALLIDVLRLGEASADIQDSYLCRALFYCIIVITDGDGVVSIDSNSCKLSKGCAVCAKPGCIWNWNEPTKLEGWILIFDKRFLTSTLNNLPNACRIPLIDSSKVFPFRQLDEGQFGFILELMRQMRKELDEKMKDYTAMLEAMLYETLVMLKRSERIPTDLMYDTFDSGSNHIAAFVDEVEQSFESHHDVGYYAEKLHITSNYLNKLAQKELGMPAWDYISQKIFSEAKRMLDYTAIPIAEISDRLNFCSASYFSRSFFKHTGQSPLQYRKYSQENKTS